MDGRSVPSTFNGKEGRGNEIAQGGATSRKGSGIRKIKMPAFAFLA